MVWRHVKSELTPKEPPRSRDEPSARVREVRSAQDCPFKAARGVDDSYAPSSVVAVFNEQVGEWVQSGDVVARAHFPSKRVAGAATSAADGQRRRAGDGLSPDGRP